MKQEKFLGFLRMNRSCSIHIYRANFSSLGLPDNLALKDFESHFSSVNDQLVEHFSYKTLLTDAELLKERVIVIE